MILTTKQRENVTKILEREFWDKYEQLAVEVIAGHWGNGQTRRELLEEAGYSYQVVQTIVNELLEDNG